MTRPTRTAAVAALALAAGLALTAGAAPARAIIDGAPAAPGQFPFVGRYRVPDVAHPGMFYLCTSSLIAPDWAITAAHCTDGLATGGMSVTFNRTRLDPADPGVKRRVAEVVRNARQDVSLLHLDAPVPVAPVRVAAPSEWERWRRAARTVTAGWGNITPANEASDLLRTAAHVVSVAGDKQGRIETVPDAAVSPGQWAYHGDSGGPLLSQDPTTHDYTLVGVLHGHYGCSGAEVCGAITANDWEAPGKPELYEWIRGTLYPSNSVAQLTPRAGTLSFKVIEKGSSVRQQLALTGPSFRTLCGDCRVGDSGTVGQVASGANLTFNYQGADDGSVGAGTALGVVRSTSSVKWTFGFDAGTGNFRDLVVEIRLGGPATPPPAPQITTPALPAAQEGKPYAVALSGSGFTGTLAWTLAAGSLPPGVALAGATGKVSGIPTADGDFPITLRATDAAGAAAERAYTLTVRPAAPTAGPGSVLAWGANYSGDLGTSARDVPVTPSTLPAFTDAVAVAAGDSSGYALHSNGTVSAWGTNDAGQLGDGTTTDRRDPVVVAGLTGVKALAAGAATGYALQTDGTVSAWGRGTDGELGVPGLTSSPRPVKVPGLRGVTAISARGSQPVALLSDGTVWTWGPAAGGALGTGRTTTATVPIRVTGLASVVQVESRGAGGTALRADGTVWEWGAYAAGTVGAYGYPNDSPVPIRRAGVSNATQVASTGGTGFALRQDGTAVAWGSNSCGILGDNGGRRFYCSDEGENSTYVNSPTLVQLPAGVTKIRTGPGIAYAIGTGGQVWFWGRDFLYQSGIPYTGSPARYYPTPTRVPGLSGVRAVAATGDVAFAVLR